jgi:hypothetical protein
MMKSFLFASMMFCVIAVVGCSEKTSVKEEKKVTTPTGTKTITTETQIKKTGDEKHDAKPETPPVTNP